MMHSYLTDLVRQHRHSLLSPWPMAVSAEVAQVAHHLQAEFMSTGGFYCLLSASNV